MSNRPSELSIATSNVQMSALSGVKGLRNDMQEINDGLFAMGFNQKEQSEILISDMDKSDTDTFKKHVEYSSNPKWRGYQEN